MGSSMWGYERRRAARNSPGGTSGDRWAGILLSH